ncbi:MAG: adenylosuccinate lyase [Finegoldia sp.]|nr:adenylosuccinate lyase [Finegoldia sp.]
MERDVNVYQNPLTSRYASYEMSHLFSDQVKFQIFRLLWTELARAEMELGLDISQEQVNELEANIDNIDFERAAEWEKELRHDVMAHVKTYGEVATHAKGVIHLGATSNFVKDNADIIIMRKALELVENKLAILIKHLSDFALEYKDMPTLGYTHLQPAQLVTVGKRACLWIQDFAMDLEEVLMRKNNLKLRGIKGTTGTQASFMELFDNDEEKVRTLEDKLVKRLGFEKAVSVTGQVYPRKIDFQVLEALSSIGQSAHKMTNDIRILQSRKEIEEPFGKNQVGSSAMAYKRNPMRSERVASLAKYLMSLLSNTQMVEATQWFERTLDDSANKRISIAEAFLATDAILEILINLTDGLVVYPKQIKAHVDEELPFMATENIMMEAVKRGGDRQEIHEKIRQYSMMASRRVKEEGLDNNLLELLAQDDDFNLSKEDLHKLLDANLYIGRAPAQVEEFIGNDIKALLDGYDTDYSVDLKV